MEIKIVKDYDALSEVLADEVLSYMMSSSEKLICLPSGDTPLGAFKVIAESLAGKEEEGLSFKLVGLDEWVGMGRETEGSCQFYMNEYLYKPGSMADSRIVEFNARAENLEAEAVKMDRYVNENGPLDIVVLGIGMNGHLGLNEPGTSFESY